MTSGPGSVGLGALLLTGGASRRMGSAKAALVIGGEGIARRLARLLGAVAAPVFEIGPGWTDLPTARESPAGAGPLVAIATGRQALVRAGHDGPALVLACDLPLVSPELLELLALRPGDRSALPVAAGRAQPLCARWSAADLDAAGALVASGERSLRSLPSRAGAELLDERTWSHLVDARAFADADTPADLDALGLVWRPGTEALPSPG